jgi:hypothetical protein
MKWRCLSGRPRRDLPGQLGTLNDRLGEEGFWCYSPGAQADFRRAMQAKYDTIEKANAAWGLGAENRFADWASVAIPSPRTPWARGAFWHAMLIWYRDSKRQLMLDQTRSGSVVKEMLGDDVKFIIYLPGVTARRPTGPGCARGVGTTSIRLMRTTTADRTRPEKGYCCNLRIDVMAVLNHFSRRSRTGVSDAYTMMGVRTRASSLS